MRRTLILSACSHPAPLPEASATPLASPLRQTCRDFGTLLSAIQQIAPDHAAVQVEGAAETMRNLADNFHRDAVRLRSLHSRWSHDAAFAARFLDRAAADLRAGRVEQGLALPAEITSSTTRHRKSRSLRVASSAENCTSSV